MGTRDTQRKQQYTAEHYDRIEITIPQGNKQLIAEHARSKGMPSINKLIQALLLQDMGIKDWPITKTSGDRS